jgi:hypothetical protein
MGLNAWCNRWSNRHNYSNPFQFGLGLSALIPNRNPVDSLLYAAQQVCK